MDFFQAILGISALGAAGGLAKMGDGAVISGQAASLDAISRAVVAGVIPPPPKPPGPPPPPGPIFCNSLVRRQHLIARNFYDKEMNRFELEVRHWQNIVAMTFGAKRSNW